ncbi:MAG: hypothetical protein IIT42_01170 [Clostridia bacterium]|nr:hypothetical protein [Clostridia bacterium]
MIINKILEFATTEEQQKIDEISKQAENTNDVLKILESDQQISVMIDEIANRYILSLNGDKELILNHVKEILESITIEDVKTPISISNASKLLKKMQVRQYSEKEIYFLIISNAVIWQQQAYIHYHFDLNDIQNLIVRKALELAAIYESQGLPKATLARLEKMLIPLDKVNANIFSLNINTHDFHEIDTTNAKKKGGEEAIILVRIENPVDFTTFEEDGIKSSRTLTTFDNRVWNVCANLADKGYNIVTLDNIYYNMGSKSKPDANKKREIFESIKKMTNTHIEICNEQEHALYPKYDLIKTEFQLLETRIITAEARGHIVDDAVKILDTPFLFQFAKARNQIASVPSAIFNNDLKLTSENVIIEQYLIRRIAHMKHSKKVSRKIILSTLFDKCNIDVEKRYQKKRSLEKIEKYLKRFKEAEWIKGYTITKEELIIAL